MTNIDGKVGKVERIVDVEEILDKEVSDETIQEYYQQNSLLYKLFVEPIQRYSWKGYIHNGISRDGEFSKDDLNEAPRIISDYVENFDSPEVLEIGMGKGANLKFLAEKHRNASFYGLDISEKNVSKAKRKLKDKNNCSVEQGDFHNLEKYEENQFSVVFAVEALCYSRQLETVFSEVEKILKPDGYFIVFDHYLLKNREELSENELKAQKLLETSFAVNKFEYYPEFNQKGTESGFEIISEEDLSEAILPTAQRTGMLTELFYEYSKLTHPIGKILPDEALYDSISGYLMKDLIEQRINGYYLTVFRK